jgi:CheY-like chemotaxis protein
MSIGIQRALIVEDNDCFRDLVKIVLNSLGVTDIVEAKDGREAIEALTTVDADLVIMDWTMAGMDGIECTERIRSGVFGSNPAIPIVMVSGNGDDNSIQHAYAAGVDVFLVKPISLKSLFAGIMKAANGPRNLLISDGAVASCCA